jgi:UDP-N-acetylmuramoyl-L-alanyl-D-glutamate--2,6-diaminopimelate ligase
MITIGILGSRGKSAVADIIESFLKGNNLQTCVIGTDQDSSREFLKLLNEEIDYCIIELSREDLIQGNLYKIKLDILIQTTFEQENSEVISAIQKLISNIKEKGYIIFNSDSIQKINFECSSIYPVTYGLNGKTTVTASSIDDLERLNFSYCLQRSIVTIFDNLVQPFEKPVKVEGRYMDVYYYLAAYTCLITLGFKI